MGLCKGDAVCARSFRMRTIKKRTTEEQFPAVILILSESSGLYALGHRIIPSENEWLYIGGLLFHGRAGSCYTTASRQK